jgi:hypothetical protein
MPRERPRAVRAFSVSNPAGGLFNVMVEMTIVSVKKLISPEFRRGALPG